jgi:uncharacterized protein
MLRMLLESLTQRVPANNEQVQSAPAVDLTIIMKRTMLCLLAAFLAAAGCAVAAEPGSTEITANGTGSISLPPDLATVSAAVETYAASANDAISSNNRIYERVVNSLTGMGIARADVSLAYYNVNYNPRPPAPSPNPSGERYGYTVSRSFAVKVRNMSNAGSVSDACLAAGATAINGVSFGLSDTGAARAQAIAKAEADARANADSLARNASLRIVSIKSIALLDGGGGGPAVMMARASPPTQFDQSNVSVTVSVSVVFLAQP